MRFWFRKLGRKRKSQEQEEGHLLGKHCIYKSDETRKRDCVVCSTRTKARNRTNVGTVCKTCHDKQTTQPGPCSKTVGQNSITTQEILHWVHKCYGGEIELNRDEEDFFWPSLTSHKAVAKFTSNSTLGESTVVGSQQEAEPGPVSVVSADVKDMTPRQQPTSAVSNLTEAEHDVKQGTTADATQPADRGPVSCPLRHDGRMIRSGSLPFPVDEMFTLLFTHNQFNVSLMETMKYTDVNVSNWEENSSTGLKTRKTEMTVPVTQSIGPKICYVTETQVLQACSKPGELYVIEVEAVNAGVPYCDSFYICNHICLTRVNATESAYAVYSQIKYRKSVWGLVKGFIEKNVWVGIDDYFKTLAKALEEELRKRISGEAESASIQKQDSTRVSLSVPRAKPAAPPAPRQPPSTPTGPFGSAAALWAVLAALGLLLLFNIVFYIKLSSLESTDGQARSSYADYLLYSEERSHEQWVSLLQRQAAQHRHEIEQWRADLKSAVSLLKQAEETLSSLQNSIHSTVSEKLATVLNSPQDLDTISFSEKHSEL